MTNSKEKMSSEEAWENLNNGVKFAKHLDYINMRINELIKEPDEREIKMLLRTNDELISQASFFIGHVLDTSERAGWFKRRSAKKLLKMLNQSFQYNQFGLAGLKQKLPE
jgi:hypothetical protein